MNLEPQTTIYEWLFQLDDSKSLHEKWLFHHQTSIKNGCLEFQEVLKKVDLAKPMGPASSSQVAFPD